MLIKRSKPFDLPLVLSILTPNYKHLLKIICLIRLYKLLQNLFTLISHRNQPYISSLNITVVKFLLSWKIDNFLFIILTPHQLLINFNTEILWVHFWKIINFILNSLIIVVITILIIFQLRSPKSQVVSHQLHDSSWVLVVALLNVFDVSNGIIEGGLGQLTSLLRIVLDLIIEDWEIEGQTESDWVSSLELGLGKSQGLFISLKSLVSSLDVEFALSILNLELSQISIVISLHFKEEDLSFVTLGSLDQSVLEELDDLHASMHQLTLDFSLDSLELLEILLFFGRISLGLLLLLKSVHDSPGSSLWSNGIFVGNREEVSLLGVEVDSSVDENSHVVEHLRVSLNLFRNSSTVKKFFVRQVIHYSL